MRRPLRRSTRTISEKRARDDHPARLGDQRQVGEAPFLGLAHDLGDQRRRCRGIGGVCAARIVAVGGRESRRRCRAPAIGDAGAAPHPGGRGERPLVGVGVLDLAADMEAEADLEADVGDALDEFDGMGRRRAEFLRQLVGGVAARRAAARTA